MKHALKIAGWLILIILISLTALYLTGKARFEQLFPEVAPNPIPIPQDPTALALGQKWADTLCSNCHSPDYGGRPLIEDDSLGTIGSPNLTSGQGGIGAAYSDLDWVRSLRHGLAPDTTPLMGMPSDAFYYMSDHDLGALIGYLKALPPVDNYVQPTSLKPLAYILISLGAFGDAFPAEHIPHDQTPPSPAPGVSLAYGQYLVRVGDCDNCHGPNLAGGESPVPGSPPGPNLTSGGTLAFWSTEEFITAMRTGQTPYGRSLNPDYMPWTEYNNFSDDELAAIVLYLQWLPARETELP